MKISDVNQAMLDSYRYGANVPHHGLMIDGLPALTRVEPEAVNRYVLLLVRDPLCAYDADATDSVAAHLQEVTVVGRSGMFTTISGRYRDVPVTALSGGSGGPEVELALMDLFEHTAADTFLRVGGSGGMHESVKPGDLVIADGAVRDEGLTKSYAPLSYPAIADSRVVRCLQTAAAQRGVPYHVGLTRSTDSDFVAGGRPAAGGFFTQEAASIIDTYRQLRVLNGDRETAAVLTLARVFGFRGGSVCSVADNIVTGEKFQAGAGHVSAIEVALDALILLSELDAQAKPMPSTSKDPNA